jgi:hypothetical protein
MMGTSEEIEERRNKTGLRGINLIFDLVEGLSKKQAWAIVRNVQISQDVKIQLYVCIDPAEFIDDVWVQHWSVGGIYKIDDYFPGEAIKVAADCLGKSAANAFLKRESKGD